jgi:ferredoxin-NADP reductase
VDRLDERLLPRNGDDVTFARAISEGHIDAAVEKFGVRVGEQPNLDQILHLEHQHGSFYRDQLGFADETKAFSSPIGVFVSGPERLKTAVQRAVAAIGSDRFDVHTEEFEL